jgi:hypothetical protein
LRPPQFLLFRIPADVTVLASGKFIDKKEATENGIARKVNLSNRRFIDNIASRTIHSLASRIRSASNLETQ